MQGSPGHIGTRGPVPAQMGEKRESEMGYDLHESLKPWEEGCMRHFDVDGPGGEVVVEVHVTRDRRGFKLVTDRQRVGTFGEWQDGELGDVVKAPPGQIIQGLTACFGNLGGWSEKEKRWSHWGLWDLGVIVTRGEGKKIACWEFENRGPYVTGKRPMVGYS